MDLMGSSQRGLHVLCGMAELGQEFSFLQAMRLHIPKAVRKPGSVSESEFSLEHFQLLKEASRALAAPPNPCTGHCRHTGNGNVDSS